MEAFRGDNPQMAVEAALRPGRHPHAVAEYGAHGRAAAALGLRCVAAPRCV